MTQAYRLEAARQGATERSPAAIVAAVLLVTCLAPLNATMIVVALPNVLAAFNVRAVTGSLLVTCYLVVMAALPPLGGRLGDRWGRRPAILAGLLLFGLAALGASLAPGFVSLITWRVLQAVGAAAAFPNAVGLLRDRISARNRGLSLGLVGAVIALSAAAGPLIGQMLVGPGGWRAVFWINLPLVAVAVGVAAPILRGELRSPPGRPGGQFGGAVAAARSVLGNRAFVVAALATGLINLALYAALVGLPLLAARSAGMLLVALLSLAALTAPAAGRLTDGQGGHGRHGAAVVGMVIFAAGLLPLAVFGSTLGVLAMTASLVLAGAGLGTSSTAIQTTGLEAAAARESGLAAGILSTSRYVGGAAGSSLAPVALAVASGEPLRGLFIMATAAVLLGALATMRLGENLQPPPRAARTTW